MISGNLPESINPWVQQFSDGVVCFREFVVSVVTGNDDGVRLGIKTVQECDNLPEEVPRGNFLQQSLLVAENMQVGQLNNSKCHDDVCVLREDTGSVARLHPAGICPLDDLGDTRLVEAAITVVAFKYFEV